MRTSDRGSTTGSCPLDRPEAQRAGCPLGRAKRVSPPLTAIFEEKLACKCGLFFRMLYSNGAEPFPTPDSPDPPEALRLPGLRFVPVSCICSRLNRTHVKAEIKLDRFSTTPYSSAPLPPRGRQQKQYGEVSEWLKEHAWKVCIRQRIEGSNPSLTATFKEELACKCELFFRLSLFNVYLPCTGHLLLLANASVHWDRLQLARPLLPHR